MTRKSATIAMALAIAVGVGAAVWWYVASRTVSVWVAPAISAAGDLVPGHTERLWITAEAWQAKGAGSVVVSRVKAPAGATCQTVFEGGGGQGDKADTAGSQH